MELEPEIIQQLLAAFAVELEEQLQVVTVELLQLEKGLPPERKASAYETVFRAAHNIKGAARGIGADAVAELAHQLESLFSRLKHSGDNPPPALVDVSLAVLDGMRAIYKGWAPGEALAPPLEHTYRTLMQRMQVELPETAQPEAVKTRRGRKAAKAPKPSAEPPVPPAPPPPAPAPTEQPPAPEPAAAGAEVLRVDLGRMRTVSALAEELEVTRSEMAEHLARVRQLERHLIHLSQVWQRVHPLFEMAAGTEDGELYSALREQDELLGSLRGLGTDTYKGLRGTTRRFHQLAGSLQHNVRMLRLVRASHLLRPLVRSARDMARELNKEIDFAVSGDEVELDRVILDGIKDPLTHLLRNAIDHGIETPAQRQAAGKPPRGQVRLTVSGAGSRIHLRLEDDGAGIDADAVGQLALQKGVLSADELRIMERAQRMEIIFRPGFSSREQVTALSGRGVGLDVVKANIQMLKGQVRVESEPGKGTVFLLDLPLTVATDQALVVRAAGGEYLIPETAVEQVLDLPRDAVKTVEASQVVLYQGRPVPLRDLGLVLEQGPALLADPQRLSLVIVSHGWRSVALLVDEVVRDREIVMKRLGWPLHAVRNVGGAALTGAGNIMMVLNPADLVASALGAAAGAGLGKAAAAPAERATPHVLVADDSITTRMLERSILEKNGYRVTVATHGRQAWELLQSNRIDLVVSDVQMPLMDGFELTAKIKQSDSFRHIPVIIVTSLGNESDKRRGIEAGADAYVVKSQFETGALLELVRRLVG